MCRSAQDPAKWFTSLILPWLVLAASFAAFYARLLRSTMVEVMGEDYIRTARAKGLSGRRVVLRHGLRAAITPVVTAAGLDIGILLGGTILTETVFNIPGIGRLAYDVDSEQRPADHPGNRADRRVLHRRREPGGRRALRVHRPARDLWLTRCSRSATSRVHFETEDGVVKAVDGVSYSVDPGRALGIVGESGSGKSVSSLTVMGLTRAANTRISGEIRFHGHDLLAASDDELRRIRGNDIAMIFQDPLSSLHPYYKVGWQLGEAIRAHNSVSKQAARARSIELLDMVGIPDPRRRVDGYPHEFSGGMRQRAMIAMALANEPKLLIADEPTTALDVTVQAQILALIRRLQQELETAVVMITHDLGVIAETVDEVGVMYAGRIVERAPTTTLFSSPEHPYTWGLLGSIPRLDVPREQPLVPIPGRPPSLITLPGGCSFHPRCPYVRDRHTKVDPTLDQVPGDPQHSVACLLESKTRRRLWSELRGGAQPAEARERVELEERPA